MSVFGPEQVEEPIFGNAVAGETTLATFIASASDKEIKVLSADGTAPAAGKDFKVYQKTAGDATKNLNYEFSDIVKADKVEKVIVATYLAESQKSVTATITAVAKTTYVLECIIYNDGGTMSPENFAVVSGYYTSAASGDTATTIRDGLKASLQANLTKRGNSELVLADSSTDALTITGKAQSVVPGKIVGRQIEFTVNGKSFVTGDITHTNSKQIAILETAQNNPGRGTGKYAVNLEWFAKGYKYDAARYGGWPADFQDRVPYYASINGVYNVIHVKYFEDRQSPTVEKQKKVLTIFVDKGTDTLALNAQTNLVLADLRTILGSIVPAALPVI